MLKKAQAWEKYNEAALLESFIKVLPELAKTVAEPLSKVEKIILVGGDKGTGASQITGQITEIIAQMPEVLKALTGADLSEYLKSKFSSKTEAKGKLNRNPVKLRVKHLRKNSSNLETQDGHEYLRTSFYKNRRFADAENLCQGQGHEG